MADDQNTTPESLDTHFEPVMKLPLVEIKTLEEDEEILFQMRGKLFRYDSSPEVKQWKERGTGDIKILLHKKQNNVRILMRRDKTLKICANHYIRSYMELEPNNTSDRAWVWKTLADFADEEAKPELLAIKFANAENAQKFKVAFDEAKKMVAIKESLDCDSDDESNSEKEGVVLNKEQKDDSTEIATDHEGTENADKTLEDAGRLTNKMKELSVADQHFVTCSNESDNPVSVSE